jgi:hypothetical protein
MSFAPTLPIAGYAGWAFLKRTLASQQAAFAAAPEVQRDDLYFRERIGSVTTAEQLVSDHRLLKVALGAFGLDDDINSRYFVRKVLEDGTLSEGALALRLSDTRYRDFSAAFGFGDFSVPRTQISDFADSILANYKTRQFEAAVGTQNASLRFALNAEREVATLAGRTTSEDTKWYSIMGSERLRTVFQAALGLPTSFAAIDLDQQLTVLKDKTEQLLGSDTVSQFTDTRKLDKLVKTYLLRSEAAATISATAKGSSALQLLQSTPQTASSGILALLG